MVTTEKLTREPGERQLCNCKIDTLPGLPGTVPALEKSLMEGLRPCR
jgi:hypothetical protein